MSPERPGTLHGQRALVTGASGGIGAAVARRLAESGATVHASGRNQSRLEAITIDIERRTGSDVVPHLCDVTEDSAIEKLVGECGAIDILVNCAGLNVPQPLVEVEAATLDLLVAVNLRAPFLLMQLVASSMLTAGRPGVIVNITSQMGHVGAAHRTAYCATKHALEGLTKAAAVELAPSNIRVVAVAPTFVRTALTEVGLADPAFAAATLASIPAGRLCSAEEVAAAVAFVAGPEASMITGTSLLVDGGWTAR